MVERGTVPVRLALAVALGLVLLVPATASAWRSPPAGAAKPYYDSRANARAAVERGAKSLAAARSSVATVRARTALRHRLGTEGVLSIDPLTGTPRQLTRTDGALSAPRSGSRQAIALDFVRANRTVLGLSDADIAKLTVSNVVSTSRGAAVVHFQQHDVRDGVQRRRRGQRVHRRRRAPGQ